MSASLVSSDSSVDFLLSSNPSFHSYYSRQYTPERWYSSLFPALLSPNRHVALVNKYVRSLNSCLPEEVSAHFASLNAKRVKFI